MAPEWVVTIELEVSHIHAAQRALTRSYLSKVATYRHYLAAGEASFARTIGRYLTVDADAINALVQARRETYR